MHEIELYVYKEKRLDVVYIVIFIKTAYKMKISAVEIEG